MIAALRFGSALPHVSGAKERGKVGKWKEISKGKLSGYRSGAIIYRKGAWKTWKIEKTGSKGKRTVGGGERERAGCGRRAAKWQAQAWTGFTF